MQGFYLFSYLTKAAPFAGGWLADRLLGDPDGWPHPIVGFGKLITLGEKRLNTGGKRKWKGGSLACLLVAGTFLSCLLLLRCAVLIHPAVSALLTTVGVFFCLAGKTLIQEVKAVFKAVDQSQPDCRTRHLPPLRARNPHGRTGNALREPERRGHRPDVLVSPARASRNDGIQND